MSACGGYWNTSPVNQETLTVRLDAPATPLWLAGERHYCLSGLFDALPLILSPLKSRAFFQKSNRSPIYHVLDFRGLEVCHHILVVVLRQAF
ncbi:hypothetical protein NIES4073_31170 [Kalymmatonema gypsitolerans NIES-4073]|nr:hypothetical protein NIES4073_31170 [Scytonema sp. NIES-4073]